MADELSAKFFKWVKSNGLTYAEVSPHLSISVSALSTYKTRGLPVKQMPMAKKLMENWDEISTTRERMRDEQTLVAKVPAWKFNQYNRLALSRGLLITDWIVAVLDEEIER